MFRTGLVSVSFRDKTPPEIIKAAAGAGLSCIEWGSDVHAPFSDTKKLAEIKEECGANGIACCSYGTYYRIGQNTVSEIMPYIEAAKILGTDVLRLWCGTKGAAEYTDREKKELTELCIRLSETAEKESVKLCLECHNNTLTDTADETVKLMNTVNSPYFKMYWQPNQYKTEKENLDYAKKISGITEIIHAFNWEGDSKYPLGSAKEIWHEYLGVFGGGTVLLEFMPDGKIESLAGEAAALKKITEVF